GSARVARAVEMAALFPVFVLGAETLNDTESQAHIRKHCARRYRLLPYLTNLLHAAHTKGQHWFQTVEGSDEREAMQIFLGRDLLAAPVFDERATTRSVRLPAGSWFEYETNKRFEGDADHRIPVEPG